MVKYCKIAGWAQLDIKKFSGKHKEKKFIEIFPPCINYEDQIKNTNENKVQHYDGGESLATL